MGDSHIYEASVKNIINKTNLKWIFVSGKGGVGKTTTSCGLAIQLSQVRESVIIVSTDPAPSLSDVFNKQISSEPTKIPCDRDNLYAMELQSESFNLAEMTQAHGIGSNLQELIENVPGLRDTFTYVQILNTLKNLNFSTVVVDMPPTGEAIQFLAFPSHFEAFFSKVSHFKHYLGPFIEQLCSVFGLVTPLSGLTNVEETFGNIKSVMSHIFDPQNCSFICVCQPDFMAVYETERLVQELVKNGLVCENIIVNQVQPNNANCNFCSKRTQIQAKYLDQINDLYEEFHVVKLPLMEKEIRGYDELLVISKYLLVPYDFKFN